jgi:hypothetical protein
MYCTLGQGQFCKRLVFFVPQFLQRWLWCSKLLLRLNIHDIKYHPQIDICIIFIPWVSNLYNIVYQITSG